MSSHNFDLPDSAGCAGDRIRRAEQAGDSDGWLHTKLTLNYTYRGLWGSIRQHYRDVRRVVFHQEN
jgi:hypothetical protein